MKNSVVMLALILLVQFWVLPAFATEKPAPVHPEDLQWHGVPAVTGLQIAWVLGEEQEAGPYLVRIKLAQGTKIPPHTHPDERNTTVHSGRLLVGFGEVFEEAEMVELGPGAVYVAPAGTAHYLWARDTATVYQESGVGPSGIQMVKP